MSDKVYLPSDIPSDYHYAVFTNDYVTLYNQPSAQNETLNYYRIYFNYSSGMYVTGQSTFSQYSRTYFYDVPVSREFFDRPDSYKIVLIIMVLAVFGLWLFNLMTSIVKKNGLLSGLL